MPMRTRTAAVAVVAALGAALLAAPPAAAASPDVVISQVYGGGGNSGAPYANDFVELANLGAAAVDLTGWSVQYASASGTSWQVTVLAGSIPAGGRYLVREAAGSSGGAALPTPDATGSIAMAAASGKVALATVATALGCGSACHAAPEVRDLVGYGSANDFEGAPVPALSNTTAAKRVAATPSGVAADTDDNAADFAVGPPEPHNSGSGDGDGGTAPEVHVHAVQGAAHRSPLTGSTVTTSGVVTAVARQGFWIADPQPDDDPATSEGVYVYTSAAPTVAAGNAVRVTGRVAEYRPGGSGGDANLTTTELTGPTVTVTAASAPLPVPVLLGPGGRTPPVPVRADAPGDVEASAAFDPATNALDFSESLEGMLVRVVDSVAVGPTSRNGELAVLPGGAGGPRTARGGIRYTAADANAERVILDDALAPVPVADVGDRLPGPVDGVIDYSFGNVKLLVLATPAVVPGGLARETTRAARADELAIATYNVENLDPTDPPAKFDRLAAGLVTNLAMPDIVALEEVQDNSGPADDHVVAADATIALLTDAIVRAGGPRYSWRSIDPVDDADGGEPGGNIRVGFLYRTDRGLSFTDRPGGDATTAVGVARRAGRATLTASPGRIAPADPAFAASRKPLAGEFRYRGRPLIVVANHFNSKGGDQPLFGRYQPPARPSETQRHAQATAVRGFVDAVRAVEADARVVLLGDLNDFEFSVTVDTLVGDGWLTDLPRTVPEPERYTYVYDGNSQVLDHILLSRPLACDRGNPDRGHRVRAACDRVDYDVVHVNADYADQVSDHDPQVVRLRP